MGLFTSTREKRLWLGALLVLVTILGVLFMGRPLANQLRDDNVQAVFFVAGMVLVEATVLMHAIKTKPGKLELSVLLGLIAVATRFIFRLGAPERSHLIEYSVLAIFIHKAMLERVEGGKRIRFPALIAFLIAFFYRRDR